MMKRIGILLLGILLCFAVVVWPQVQPQCTNKIITFDVPGAGTSAGQGTYGYSINNWGAITGYYADDVWLWHSFLRAPDGTITTFDDPGAGAAPDAGEGTVAYMIGTTGAIVGAYVDANQVYHGFLRALDGTFTTINAPGAGAGIGTFEGTSAGSINPTGWILGSYADADFVYHAYVRTPNGKITEFDVRGAGNAAGQGTFVASDTGLNASGTATGWYVDSNGMVHGYVRAADGAITKFNVSSAGTGAGQGTGTSGINSSGAITGWYIDENTVDHGFLRNPNGAITKFDVPGAGAASGQGTAAIMINDSGWITGEYIDANGVDHGFLRAPDGAFIPFDVPGAGTQSGQGTTPLFINSAGAIAGYYADPNSVVHGFVRLP